MILVLTRWPGAVSCNTTNVLLVASRVVCGDLKSLFSIQISLRLHDFLEQRLQSALNPLPTGDVICSHNIAYPSPRSEACESDFLAFGPDGKAPALKLDDGIVLTGVNAILLLLCGRHSTLYLPQDKLERRKCYSGCSLSTPHEPCMVYPSYREGVMPRAAGADLYSQAN